MSMSTYHVWSCPDCFQAANAVCAEPSPAIPTSLSTPRMPRHKSSPLSKHPWHVQKVEQEHSLACYRLGGLRSAVCMSYQNNKKHILPNWQCSIYYTYYIYTQFNSFYPSSFQTPQSVTHICFSIKSKHLVQQLHHMWCPTFHPPVLCSRWVSHTFRRPRWPPNWQARPARKFPLRSADLLLSALAVAWRT